MQVLKFADRVQNVCRGGAGTDSVARRSRPFSSGCVVRVEGSAFALRLRVLGADVSAVQRPPAHLYVPRCPLLWVSAQGTRRSSTGRADPFPWLLQSEECLRMWDSRHVRSLPDW